MNRVTNKQQAKRNKKKLVFNRMATLPETNCKGKMLNT